MLDEDAGVDVLGGVGLIVAEQAQAQLECFREDELEFWFHV